MTDRTPTIGLVWPYVEKMHLNVIERLPWPLNGLVGMITLALAGFAYFTIVPARYLGRGLKGDWRIG